MPEHSEFKVYGYRWVVLAAYMIIVMLNQLLWITFAPVTVEAAKFYGVSELYIGLLSMSFMIVYIVVSIPASWAIDTYGIKIGVGIGAVLTGIFGLMRGLVTDNYALVLTAQIGIAVGQPFVLNAVTSVAAKWFPMHERATAVGLGSLAIYLGILGGVALTPWLAVSYGFIHMLLIFGVASMIAAAIFVVLTRERPPTPPCPPELEARSLVFDGLKKILRQRDFVLLLFIFFIGLGVFNAVTTWIEDILRPRGFSGTQAGTVGGLMIAGGILGAIVLPLWSDHIRKRTPFIVAALAGSTLGLAVVAYAHGYDMVLAGAFLLGFFLLSAGPIGFQLGAESTYPTPEGTSNGLLILMGQISGIAFIFGMNALRSGSTGSMTNSLTILIVLMVVSLISSFFLKEPKTLLAQELKEE